MLAAALLGGCTYDPPTWHYRVENAMPQPRDHRFAVMILATQSQAPTGLSAWPDGGKARVLRQTAKLWLCDPERGAARLMALVERPKAIRSEYAAWIVGWDSTGDYRSIYTDVRGRSGETSDTEFLRWLLKVEVGPDTSRALAVPFLPPRAAPPRGPGPLRGGREMQISAGDTMRVRTDVDPEWRSVFRVDPETGDVVALETDGASPRRGSPSP
jgi:hypothetical protein